MAPAAILADDVRIIDIRQNDLEISLAKDIYRGLDPGDGKARSLPTILLYDTEGLRLFEEITYLDEYYLTNAEIEVLTSHAKSIVQRMPDDAQLVELGSGCVVLLLEIPWPKRLCQYTSPLFRLFNSILGTCARSRSYSKSLKGPRRMWTTMPSTFR